MKIESPNEVREVAHVIQEAFRAQQRIAQPTDVFWEKVARAALLRVAIILQRKEAEAWSSLLAPPETKTKAAS